MTSELDPAGVLTRSDEAAGYVSLTAPVDAVAGTPAEPAATPALRSRERESGPLVPRWWPAAAALVLALAVVVLDAVAVSLAGAGSFVAATAVAWVAIALSVLAVLGGVAVVVLGMRTRRRSITGFGAVAVVLGVLANPWLLTRLLELVG